MFSAAAGAGAEDLVWENDNARLVLTSKGEFQAVVDLKTGKEYRPMSAAPFMTVVLDGTRVPATSAVKTGDTVDFAFGKSGVSAQLRITTHPLYFLVELANLTGAAPDSVEFGNVPADIKEHVGDLVNAVWNDAFAVCVMGLSPKVEGRSLSAIVHRQFGLDPAKAAILALPSERFYEAVQRVEKDHGLPYSTLGGQWAKTSDDVRRGYLFIDLTEHNVDEIIRWAKLGEFRYILTYAHTWATTRGSYPINLKNFPSGEAGLKAVVDKCHAAGLKVGIHYLTSFVAKRDPLVTPIPDARLLKDRFTALATDITQDATTIPATDSVADWPAIPSISFVPDSGMDIQIGDEIIGYTLAGGPDGRTFVKCERGLHGTRPAAHRKGAKIEHLAQRYGHYFADLRTSLNDEMAERIAGVVNRCGLDMLYFDGAASNAIMGPEKEKWYWVTAAQQAVWQRLKREVLVEGPGRTPWTWHFYTRGVTSDRVYISPKTYLDYFKLDNWQEYRDNFLPAHLGWWGVFDHQNDHPATTPDEVELHGVRMLALDSPIALETKLEDLQNNARAEEMLRLLGRYERVRLSRRVPDEVRERLMEGEWRMEMRAGEPAFVPVSHQALRFDKPGAVTLEHRGAAQPLAFRLRAQPRLAAPGDAANRVLFRSPSPLPLETPTSDAFIPGGLANRVEFAKVTGDQPQPELVGTDLKTGQGRPRGAAPALTTHRALAVQLEVEGPAPRKGELCPVLNVQLEAANRMFRDHHIDLDFRGSKTVILPGPTPDRTLPELWPSRDAYFYRHAMMAFDYTRVTALNFRWMRTAGAPATGKDSVRVRIHSVEALRESDTVLRNPTLSIGDAKMLLPIELPTDGYAEFSGVGDVRVFDANGRELSTPVKPTGAIPILQAGTQQLKLRADEFSPINLTVITTGQP